MGEWTICEAEKPVIKFGEKGKRKEQTDKVVLQCSRKRKTLICFTQKNCKAWFLFYRIMSFYWQMQLNDKTVPRVFLIFIINMGSLKSERIDSTETTIS